MALFQTCLKEFLSFSSCELLHQHPDLLQPQLKVQERGQDPVLQMGRLLQEHSENQETGTAVKSKQVHPAEEKRRMKIRKQEQNLFYQRRKGNLVCACRTLYQ